MIGHQPAAQDTSCPLCGKTDSQVRFRGVTDYLTGEDFEVRRCASCGVGYTWPQPPSLNRFYPRQYRQYGGTTQRILKFLYDRRVRDWVRDLGPSGLALEVGCGAGWMLGALSQQGWKTVGIERSVLSAVAARTTGIPVFVGDLDGLKPDPSFDLIILFQVLEHLQDPLGTLQQVAKLLKPGGSVVLAVPNLEGWQARVAGRSWFHLDVPRHLYHFSKRSLFRILSQAGLAVRYTRFSSFEHDPYGWVQSLLNQLGFPQNLLTKMLMGVDRRAVLTPVGLTMVVAGGLLVVPSFLLAMASWAAGAGASVEVVAAKAKRKADAPDDALGQQAFYDDIWVAWRDMQRFAPAPRYLRRTVMRELRRLEFESVLDMGCGEGTLLRMIAERYPKVSLAGSELSATALRYCKEQLPRAHLFRLDIVRDEVQPQTYDLIISVQVLEHLKDDLAALRNLWAMCRRYVLISVPGGELDEHGRRMGHYRHYTKDGLVQKMEQAGFRVVRIFTCGWPVHSLLYRQLVRRLPRNAVEQVGLGQYDWKKRTIMNLADFAYRLNLPFVGTEVFAIGVPTHDTPGASP